MFVEPTSLIFSRVGELNLVIVVVSFTSQLTPPKNESSRDASACWFQKKTQVSSTYAFATSISRKKIHWQHVFGTSSWMAWVDKQLINIDCHQHNFLWGSIYFGIFFLFFWEFFSFFGPLVPWSSNPLVPWSSRPPSSRPLIVWSPVPWSSGPLVLWSPGPLVPCSSGPLVPCSSGLWSPGPLFFFVPFFLTCLLLCFTISFIYSLCLMFVSLVFLCYFYVAEVFMRFSVLISVIFIRCMFFLCFLSALFYLFFISYVFLFFVSFIVIIVYFFSFILVHVLLLFQCSSFPFFNITC